MTQKFATFNDSNFPIVTIKFAPIEPTEAEFDEYLATMEKYLLEAKPFARIFDASEAKYLPATLRIKQGQWVKQNKEAILAYSLGSAYIMPSLLIRMMFQAILIISPLPDEYTIVSTMEDAQNWAQKQINKHLNKGNKTA